MPSEAASTRRRTAANRLSQLAGAAYSLETHRDRLAELEEMAEPLQQSDLIVVDGEIAVLDALNRKIERARTLLQMVSADPAQGDALEQLEQLVSPSGWTVLDSMRDQLATKIEILDAATKEIQASLGPWTDLESETVDINDELRQRKAVLPREVSEGRDRFLSLVGEVRKALEAKQLLLARSLLHDLEADTPQAAVQTGTVAPVPAAEIKVRLDRELDAVRQRSGRVQLTVLRGPLAAGRFEYTLMLLAPGGEGHVGVNVQDTSTIVVQDRQYFLGVLYQTGGVAYRTLRHVVTQRDLRPEAAVDAPDQSSLTMPSLRSMGAVLYKLLLPDRMKDELLRNPNAQLTITTNDMELPWEVMFDGDPAESDADPGDSHFLALQRPVARMPVGRARGRWSPAIDHPRSTRRIALIASTGNPVLQEAVREVQQIQTQMKDKWKDRVDIDVLMTGGDNAPGGKRFREVLLSRTYDIIHFAGHAAYEPSRPDQSGLLLDGEEVCFAQKIQRLLAGHPLVFLNACETARLIAPSDRPPPEGTYEGDPNEGLASAFVYGGALACIGTAWPVSDAVAAAFAVEFYGQVLEGQPLGYATLAARRLVAGLPEQADDPSWAAFVLYGDPTFQLPPLLHPEGS